MAKIPRVQQILDLSIETVNKMTAAELKQNVQILASAANKRLARLGSTEIGRIAPAYLSAAKRSYTGAAGGKFGTAGKSRNQLLNEFKAVKSFMQMKTSSVSAWKDVRKKSYERAGVPLMNDAGKEKEFWSTYRKIQELYPNLKNIYNGSPEAQRDLRQIMFGSEERQRIIDEINAHNARNFKHVFDENDNMISVEKLGDVAYDYLIDDKGNLFEIDFNEPEDILKIMQMKVGMEYERNEYSAQDDEFFEL